MVHGCKIVVLKLCAIFSGTPCISKHDIITKYNYKQVSMNGYCAHVEGRIMTFRVIQGC